MKILWIDDDAYDLKYLLHNLESDSFSVEQVDNLPEAYDILKTRGNSFSLIVLDLLMPKTDKYGQIPEWLHQETAYGEHGIILLERIRQEISTEIIVVILSIVGAGVIKDLNLEQYHPVEVIRKTPGNINIIESKIKKILKTGIIQQSDVEIME